MLVLQTPRSPAPILACRGIRLRPHVRPNAFGNALGNSIVGQLSQPSQQAQKAAQVQQSVANAQPPGAVFNWDDMDFDVGPHALAAKRLDDPLGDLIASNPQWALDGGGNAGPALMGTRTITLGKNPKGLLGDLGDNGFTTQSQKMAVAGWLKTSGQWTPGKPVSGQVTLDLDYLAAAPDVFEDIGRRGVSGEGLQRVAEANARENANELQRLASRPVMQGGQGNVPAGATPAVLDVRGLIDKANYMPHQQNLTREELLTTRSSLSQAMRTTTDHQLRLNIVGALQSINEAGGDGRGLLTPTEVVGGPGTMDLAMGSGAFGGSNGSAPSGVRGGSYVGPSNRSAFRAYENKVAETGKLPNLYPGDPAMPGPRYKLIQTESGDFKYQLPSGELRTPKGAFDFIQTGGEIKISPVRNDGFSTHLQLSKGSEVDYAGSIQFSQKGALKWWDNSSGHYQPPAARSPIVNLPTNLFKPISD